MKTFIITAILAAIGIVVGTLTSRGFWQLFKKKNVCTECDGTNEVHIDGEDIWVKCEQCQLKSQDFEFFPPNSL